MADSFSEDRVRTAVKAMPIKKKSHMEPPMILPPISFLPSPSFCPMKTVTPMERLTMMPVIVNMSWEPVETAETSADSANQPTTNRSTAPYSACRNMAKSTGSAKRKSGPSIFPCVKSAAFDIFLLSFSPSKKAGQMQAFQPAILSSLLFPVNSSPSDEHGDYIIQ